MIRIEEDRHGYIHVYFDGGPNLFIQSDIDQEPIYELLTDVEEEKLKERYQVVISDDARASSLNQLVNS